MAFTRTALKARAKVRKDATAGCGYTQLLKQGEAAFRAGQPITSNPHADADDAEVWADGWRDAEEVL